MFFLFVSNYTFSCLFCPLVVTVDTTAWPQILLYFLPRSVSLWMAHIFWPTLRERRHDGNWRRFTSVCTSKSQLCEEDAVHCDQFIKQNDIFVKFVKWTCKLPVIFWTFDMWQCFSRAFNRGALFSYNYMKVAQSHSQQHVWNIHWANCRTIALCTLTSSQEMFSPIIVFPL